MDFRNTRRLSAGFTLVEFISTLAIGGVLVATAVPTYRSSLARGEVTAEINGFITHLHLARSEAVKRGQRVALCPSTDGTNCTRDYRRWNEGYITFVDLDTDRQHDSDEPLLRVYQGSGNMIQIQTSSNYRKVLSYRPDGSAWGSNTTVRFCKPDVANLNRAISLLGTGRPRLMKKMQDGSNITCD